MLASSSPSICSSTLLALGNKIAKVVNKATAPAATAAYGLAATKANALFNTPCALAAASVAAAVPCVALALATSARVCLIVNLVPFNVSILAKACIAL